MSETVIKVENLNKVYKLYDKPIDRMKEALSISKKKYSKDHYALNNISFEIKRGDTVGIIGTNGSGKSTLLKIITGVLTQSFGTVEVNGKISALLELGAGFNPEYTGIENIYLNGTMMGYTKEEMDQRLQSVVDFADIGEFINQPVKTYSSGMFARLAFAVAINVEPDILIVDEALSVGDVFFQNKCYRKIKELRDNYKTILFVSHDTDSVKELCKKAIWLENGILMGYGESKEIVNKYVNKIENKSVTNVNSTYISDKIGEYKFNPLENEIYPEISYTNDSQLNDNVKIISCYFNDENGNIVKDLQTNRIYEFNMIFETYVDIEKCIVGFTIETKKGLWVINSNSSIHFNKESFIVRKNERVKSVFRFELPSILKGQYIVSTAVSDGDILSFKVITWLYNVILINIKNDGANAALIDIRPDIYLYSSSIENFK